MKEKSNFYINLLIILILLDIVTTLLCIMLGGIEFNPISLFFISQSYFLFVFIKIIMIIGMLILNNYTVVFKNKLINICLISTNIIFLIIVSLNILYIIMKIIGMI